MAPNTSMRKDLTTVLSWFITSLDTAQKLYGNYIRIIYMCIL